MKKEKIPFHIRYPNFPIFVSMTALILSALFYMITLFKIHG